MKLGLIGYPLGHSWSPQIHEILLGERCYELMPLKEEDLADFLKRRDFDGINVTIPYKQTVIPYLDEIDDAAREIGAVNCIANRDGKLVGSNTDYEGFRDMIINSGINMEGQNIAVLGSGGASKAVTAAIRSMSGNPYIVSRVKKEGVITYEELYEQEALFAGIVNTTPVGMAPQDDCSPVDLERFSSLKYVVDIIANPLRTRLLFDAQMKGLKTLGGFEMLVRQAFAADRFFFQKEMDPSVIETCMRVLYRKKRSIVLIGMPTSGKSTAAKLLCEQTGRRLIEMDDCLVEMLGTSIRECFDTKGEKYFREKESELADSLKNAGDAVISTGGGIIKNRNNICSLCKNGIVVWIDRDPKLLFGTNSRPLSQNKDDILKLYEERKDLYQQYADIIIENNGSIEETIRTIIERTGE